MLKIPIALAVLGIAYATPGRLDAQPPPFVFSVVNSASYSASSIAQGSIFTVFGYGMGPLQLQQAGSYPLPSQISGTSIKVMSGSTILSCPMIYVSFYQAAAIMPSATPLGMVTILVSNGSGSGNSNVFQVSAGSFGAFTTSSSGIGPGIVTGTDYDVKTFSNSARPGETVLLWGTGLGATTGPDDTVPQSTKQFSDVEVFVGTVSAQIVYAGRSGCCAGLDQIAIQVPAASLGCFVPIAVRTAGKVVSNFVTIPVNTAGGQCVSEAPGIPTSILTRALGGATLNLAAIAVGPIRVLQRMGFSFSQGIADQLSALLHEPVSEADVRKLINPYRRADAATIKQLLRKYRIDPKQVHGKLFRAVSNAISIDQQGAGAAFGNYRNLSTFSPLFAANFTSVGTCTVPTGVGSNGSDARSRPLDAGNALSFVGPLGARPMPRISNGQYQVSLGSGFQNTVIPQGMYSISGIGGADVRAFTASLNETNTISWTNKSSITNVDRTLPLTVTWTGGPASGYVLIGGTAHAVGQDAAFLCVEKSAQGSFTVPSFVLSALPATAASDTYFFVAPHPFTNIVTLNGIDLAYFVDGSSDYTQVAVH